MNIEITIKADALVGAINKLADAITLSASVDHYSLTEAKVENGEIVLPEGSKLTINRVERTKERKQGEPAAAEPEKPKRTRKAAAKAPESAQAAAVARETPQPEQVTPEPEKPTEAPQDAPELGAPQYGDPAAVPTIDQIAAAGAKLLDEDANKMSALLDLLGKYGVQAITQLKPEQLAGFAADLRALGAEV